MSTVTNPLSGLIEGLLQGHALGMQLKRQQMEEQAFKTNQALHNQQMSIQDLMNEDYIRSRGGREIKNGMIEEPGSTVPGMQSPDGLPVPGAQSVSGIVRKPGGNGRFTTSITDSQGNKKQYEMPSPEEQQQIATQRELQSKTQLMRGEATAQQDISLDLRKRMLSTPGLAVAAPAGLESLGYAQGTPILKSDLPGILETLQKIRNGDQFTLKPGEVRLSQGGMPGAAQPAEQQPQYAPGEFQDLSQAGAVQGPPGARARWDALLNWNPSQQGSGAPAAAGAGASMGTAGGPRVIATGGPPLPTDDFGKYFLPAYAREKSKKVDALTLDEVAEARAEFTGENRNPTEASLAWKSIHGKNAIERAQANQALLRLDQSKREARPVTNILNSDSGKQAIEAAAQSIASGDLTRLRDIAGMRSGERLLIYNRVKQLNPKFNPAEVDRKIKMEDYYANGHGANNLQSFGTFLEHGGAALDAIHQISTSNSRLLNKPLNWFRKNATGSPEYVNLMAALEPVRKEFEGFLLGGRALYGDDRKSAETILSDDSGLSQIQAALTSMGHTASARFNEENNRYKKVMGHDLVDPFSPEAQEGARKIGVTLPTGGTGATGGLSLTYQDHVFTFKDQKTMNQFKKDQGIQ